MRITGLEGEGGRRRPRRKRQWGTRIMMILKLRRRYGRINFQLHFDSIRAYYLPFLKRALSEAAGARTEAKPQSWAGVHMFMCLWYNP